MGLLGDILGVVGGPVGGIVGSIASSAIGGNAAGKASRQQREAIGAGIGEVRGARDQARADLDPFAQFGSGQIDPLEALLTPEGQADFLTDNPIFEAILQRMNEDTNKSAAARGRLSAGDTAEELFDNFLRGGIPLLQNQTSNLFRATAQGQNAALGQGSASLNAGNSIADLLSQGGIAQSAGTVGQANATQRGITDLISALPGLLQRGNQGLDPNGFNGTLSTSDILRR